MKVHRRGSLLDRQLHAEVRRIRRLLERSRRTRRQVCLLIALRSGARRRKAGAKPAVVGRPASYRRVP